jgi:hypothetical protein
MTVVSIATYPVINGETYTVIPVMSITGKQHRTGPPRNARL